MYSPASFFRIPSAFAIESFVSAISFSSFAIVAVSDPCAALSSRISWLRLSICDFPSSMAVAFRAVVSSHQHAYLS